MTRSRDIHTIVWQGITIEISYEANWLNMDGPYSTAHLEIRATDPDRAPLPMTETGYRSHFANPAEIDAAGGPVRFVQEWLAHEAQSKAWKDHEAAARQYSLF